MICNKNDLYEIYQRLLELEANFLQVEKLNSSAHSLTIKQITYLKIIDSRYRITFSELAQETNHSKPTITEVINNFISLDCVYRVRSQEDRRVFYIYLTPKGKSIARTQETTQLKLIERIQKNLSDDEIKQFISLLKRVL